MSLWCVIAGTQCERAVPRHEGWAARHAVPRRRSNLDRPHVRAAARPTALHSAAAPRQRLPHLCE